MKKIVFILFLVLVSFSAEAVGQEIKDSEDPNMLSFHIDSLVLELRGNDKRWVSFIRGKNVLTGVYHLKSGEEDGQQPHDTDEVYYVVEGKAKFVADGKETIVQKGSILFVKALVAHRFVQIEEDLVVLVFFDQ